MLGLSVNCYEVTRATFSNPESFARIMEWFRLQADCQDFPVTSIQVNRNLMTQIHRDTANLGPSAIVTFGSFVGGEVLNAAVHKTCRQRIGNGDEAFTVFV